MPTETVRAVYNRKDEEGKTVESLPVSVPFDFGGDLDEVIEMFSREVVFHHAVSSLRVALQGFIRSSKAEGKSDDEILTEVSDWTPPSGKPRGKSKLDKILEALGNMSPEEREQILAKFDADPEDGREDPEDSE